MSFNVADSVEIPLSTFSGLVTEMAPSDLPEGVSPDCQDVVFQPGSVSSRPGVARLYPQQTFSSSPIVYGKSYQQPNGASVNLFYNSLGQLNVTNGINPPTLLLTGPTGTYAKSVTAFGREYIAISDGLHGQYPPIQYDNDYGIGRFTQDGPGVSPTIQSVGLPSAALSGNFNSSATGYIVQTATAHNLQVGYQVQIAGIPSQPVGGVISSIVIDNEAEPGIATVTTTNPHTLLPNLYVTLTGISGTTVGGSISLSRAGDVVTATSTTAHNLTPGANVTISGASSSTFNSSVIVASVVSPTVFTYVQVDSDTTATGATVTLNWPIPDTTTPNYYEVLTCPTSTTFQVNISYCDGTWSGGSVNYSLNGTFFVSAVPTTTEFGTSTPSPVIFTNELSGATATPYGQAAPGTHQMQVAFLTNRGYITAPSPPVTFTANGGQFLSVSGIPIGPSNVVGRILLFTGAEGGTFFYIPVPAQVNGQVVSTATQINDNTSTTAFLDFSDNTLFEAIGASIPGNTIANQIVIDSALGFGFYADRMIVYGMRNRILNLLNMAFDGGYVSSTPNVPTGWSVVPGFTAGVLVNGLFGQGWQGVTGSGPSGVLQQSFYEDFYGAPIATAATEYTLRCWLKTTSLNTDVQFACQLISSSTGFSAFAIVSGASMSLTGSFCQVNFNLLTPAVIPSDLGLRIFFSSMSTVATITVDEISIIYTASPYLNTILYGSYVENPEAIDGVTGKFGPSQDTRQIMNMATLRQTLYVLTREPSGRLHQTSDNGTTEPAGWNFDEVAANCGALSAFSLTVSQSDDETASGGEEWFIWASLSGARIFGGDQPWKISQEIQPDWDSINPAAYPVIWALNDPVARVCYFGLPVGASTVPNIVYPMNYRELDSSYQIGNSPPVHTSLSGKLVCTDNTRKWTRWNLPLYGAESLISGNTFQTTFFGVGNVYTLSSLKLIDDDYGLITPYYTTAAFVGHDQEQGLQIGSHRKLLAYLMCSANGTGMFIAQVLCNALSNLWPYQMVRPLQSDQTFDMEWGGGSAQGQRYYIKLGSIPVAGSTNIENAFSLYKLIVAMKADVLIPVRGSAF